ncbi:ABC transporter ATP-binding protein [Desulfonatronum sp. SC1]|uniref:ABC transporter ATP-binding protein n=1 Tax=Desulfonatronum sp. SC1 TaxID=2109626 RepID=UPI000D2F9DD3|nr:ABC transporter ATP-binding protein [Desulfonatronum sp. SC1]PTN32756.1 ABC transporter [Desulfonatronum sp. SC1]
MPDNHPLLLLQTAVKRREQAGSVFQLSVPDFAVHPGEIVAVVGDSGCGKSTLLDMLALVMRPTSVGRFAIQPDPAGAVVDVRRLWERGDETYLAGLRRHYFGYVLQTGGLLSFLTIRENVTLPLRLHGQGGNMERVEALADRLGVAQCLDRYPDSLSIGQRQRVAIIRALAHDPALVLADEPTAAVDKPRARLIMDELHALARENRTAVVVVTHDMDLVANVDARFVFELEQVSDQEIHSRCLEAV